MRERAVAAVAERQHGVVSVAQLRAVGLDKHDVSHRVSVGRLHRIHRGVYAVGHGRLSPQATCMAAVLACGRGVLGTLAAGNGAGCRSADRDAASNQWGAHDSEIGVPVLDYWGAAVSHRSAAALWGLLPWKEGPIDVSVPGDSGRSRRPAIRLRRRLSLQASDVTLCGGIPVTTPRRTIMDLGRVASSGRPRAAGVREGSAGRQGLVSPRELRRAIRQADILGLPAGPDGEGDRTRSDLERAFLRLCRRHRLPAPEVNVRVGRYLVDFLWRDRRLIVETDGYLYHRGKTAFEDDRARDLELRALGYEVVRLSERQVDEQPRHVAEVLGAFFTV